MKESVESRYWRAVDGGDVQCVLCPQFCRIAEGHHGICFVRRNIGGRLRSIAWNRVSGIAVDPIEKKPLYHFLPGTGTLSLGGIGCNFSCRFCQNFTISKPSDDARLGERITADEIPRLAHYHGCPSVSFTYNEPIVAFEFVTECARSCRAAGLKTVAVTNGYISDEARAEFFGVMDAANVDLKAFTEDFYRKLCGAKLAPVKETLIYLRRNTRVWLEVTTLLIPGANDSESEIDEMTRWAVAELGPDVPWHFSAFFPTYKMTDRPPTPPATLRRAREIALRNGLQYVYLGNVGGSEGQDTCCATCGRTLIRRRGFGLEGFGLSVSAGCPGCGAALPGIFENTE